MGVSPLPVFLLTSGGFTAGGFWALVRSDCSGAEEPLGLLPGAPSTGSQGAPALRSGPCVLLETCANVCKRRARICVCTHVHYVKFWDLETVLFLGNYYSIKEVTLKLSEMLSFDSRLISAFYMFGVEGRYMLYQILCRKPNK